MFELKTVFNYLYSLVVEEPKRVFIIVGNNFAFMHRIVKEKLLIDARSLPIEKQSLTTSSWIVGNVDGNVLIMKRALHNRQQLNSSENQSSSWVPSMEETFVTADDLKPEATVPDNKDALVTVETQNTPEALTTGKEHHPDLT